METAKEHGVQTRRGEPLSPLAQLVFEAEKNKYLPTPQEGAMLAKCASDFSWYSFNGAAISSALAWMFTGLSVRLKVFPTRMCITACSAFVGREISATFASKVSMERILALEESPLRGELIAILQRDFPQSELLRKALQQQNSVLLPVSDTELSRLVEGEWGGPVVKNKDWKDLKENNIWDEQLKRKNALRNILRIPRTEEGVPAAENKKIDEKGAEVLVDPFSIMHNSIKDTIFEDGEQKNQTLGDLQGLERRRSRMSAKERSAYNRRQYKQKHSQNT